MLQDIKMIRRESEPTHEGVARKILEDYKQQGGDKKGGSRLGMWALAAGSLVVLVFAISLLFADAKVTITPKAQSGTLENATYTAVKDAQSTTSAIGFQYVNFSGEETTTIPASGGTKEVSEKAKGTVVVYNEYSTAPQKLVVNTRLESPDGKIYRMNNAVTVPGYTKSGTKIVPGSVKVSVTADQPGETYNIGLVDFTIPGFKGSPQYAKFYGRSETAMTGGATGTLYAASKEAFDQASASLELALKDKLASQVRAQIPKGYVLLDGAVSFTPDTADSSSMYSKTDTVNVVKRGTVNAILLDEAALSSRIAEDTVSQYAGELVTVMNMRDLTLVLKDTPTAFKSDTTEIAFTLSGNPEIVWVIDEAKLKEDLAGEGKREFRAVLKNYSGIESAEVVFKPFWKMSFPEKIDSIEVKNTILK